MESKIFVRNRVLGCVSNSVPLKARYIKKRKENVIVTCVGKSFYTWSSTKFSLLSISPQHETEIHCLEGDTFLLFTASGNIVQAWRRGVELKRTYQSSSLTSVYLLLPFGPHLLGVDEANVLTVWDICSEDVYLELNFERDSFHISALCHPHTYVNKILLGSKQGAMQLWNLNSSKLIHSFIGWESAITTLVQSPAVDVVAVGMQNGKIVLHNIKFDETLMTFVQDWGSVKRLSFCTDNQTPIMASCSDSGHIVFWHLEQRKVLSQLLNAHDEAVCGLEYLPNEQLIVSSSADNSLKMWLFDVATGSAHLLHVRQGHKSSPALVRFHGAVGNYVLSAGSDGYMRAFNTETEIANKCLGRALKQKTKRRLKKRAKGGAGESDREDWTTSKVMPITYFSAEATRDKEWDGVAALHPRKGFVSTWSFDACKFGKFIGRRTQKISNVAVKKITATSLFVTHCGNYVLVGYTHGVVDRFNIQSGARRGTFGENKAHDGWVTGLFADNVNRYVMSGGADGCVVFWSFAALKKQPFARIDLQDPVTFFRWHGESALVAVALQNYNVLVVDADTRSVVRKFVGHSAELTDLTYSPDCRWLVSASMDSTLRTWDIPSGKCVDSIALDKPCVSLTFSPTGACLATAHVECLGVTLWSNRCLFSLVGLSSIDDCVAGFGDEQRDVDSSDDCADLLITFSDDASLAITHSWRNILNVEMIRERNRLKEPPKVPTEAPFILPIIPAVNVKFDLSDVKNAKKNAAPHDRFLKPVNVISSTLFAKLLMNAADDCGFEKAIEKLKSMSLLAIAFEINSLSPGNGGSTAHLLKFIDLLQVMYRSKRCFEIASSFLAQFLKAHSSVIINEANLITGVEQLAELHDKCWSNLESKFLYDLSVCNFLLDS